MRFLFSVLSLAASLSITAKPVENSVSWYDGTRPVTCNIQKGVDPVVHVAMQMFSGDIKAVTGQAAVEKGNAMIQVVQLDKCSKSMLNRLSGNGVPVDELKSKIDGFYIAVVDGKILVAGTNGRGAAYGLLELSRKAGVNPWVWWGDETPEHKDRLTIDNNFTTLQGASVEYRGIFINDEDWSLRPWSFKTFDKSEPGTISARTYKKIFQLLLRLRANAFWPAMHPGTTAFFQVPGAKAVADSCGIAIGTSHCEPMLRNNVGEWDVSKRGRYNYITNKKSVQDYWIERLKEVKNSKGGNLFTIGMRGIHDGSMEGVTTMQEKFDGLQQVINDQQDLLRKYVGDPSQLTQVFVPYKEVLEIYEKGLKVPDYVTLMWCDDNYGYMTRLSNAEEQKRSGGGGVYYHLSYWGRPHDYLWLTTQQPGLIYNEMRAAYDHNVRKLWIVNVHDPKVAGYDLELFLDLAWNINSVKANTLEDHYKAWLCRQFGYSVGERLFPAMRDFYKLCGERHPEFMGWSQVELDDKLYDYGYSPVRNTEFTSAFGDELDRYLDNYTTIAKQVKDLEDQVPARLKDAYFAAIEYPVLAADANARKLLWAQKARQYTYGGALDLVGKDTLYHAVAESQKAYQEIYSLTDYYNNKLAGGKWRYSMDMRPRDLPVYWAPVLPVQLTDEQVKKYADDSHTTHSAGLHSAHSTEVSNTLLRNCAIARNACDFQSASDGAEAVQMLGHSMNAVALPNGGALSYDFTVSDSCDAELRVALIPTQPNDSGDLRFSVSVDGAEPTVFSLKEPFRSERWKQNVLRGQSVRSLRLNGLLRGPHKLVIKALDDHIVVDQWMIDSQPGRRFYLFPVQGN